MTKNYFKFICTIIKLSSKQWKSLASKFHDIQMGNLIQGLEEKDKKDVVIFVQYMKTNYLWNRPIVGIYLIVALSYKTNMKH